MKEENRVEYFFSEFDLHMTTGRGRLIEVSLADGHFGDVLKHARSADLADDVKIPETNSVTDAAIGSFRYKGVLIERDHFQPEGAILWHTRWP